MVNSPPGFAWNVPDSTRETSGPSPSAGVMCVRPCQHSLQSQGWSAMVPSNPGILRKNASQRIARSQTTVAIASRRVDVSPRLIGRVDDRSRFYGGPHPRALVMCDGPPENLLLGQAWQVILFAYAAILREQSGQRPAGF